MLSEYGLSQDSMALYCDNMSATNISKNPVQYSHTKHIDIHHHFIHELVETNVINFEHVRSSVQLVDILTKPLKAMILESLWAGLTACKFNP